MACIFLVTACEKDKVIDNNIDNQTNEEKVIPQESTKVVTQQFKLDKVETRTFHSFKDGNSQELDKSKEKDYFNDRISAFTPSEIIIKKDSTIIIKPENIQEVFKSKIENDKTLKIKLTNNDNWQTLAEVNGNVLALKIVFYYTINKNESHSSSILGQQYNLSSPNDFKNCELIWLLSESIFKKTKQ